MHKLTLESKQEKDMALQQPSSCPANSASAGLGGWLEEVSYVTPSGLLCG